MATNNQEPVFTPQPALATIEEIAAALAATKAKKLKKYIAIKPFGESKHNIDKLCTKPKPEIRMNKNISFKKIFQTTDYRKTITWAAGCLVIILSTTHQAAISQGLTQNHTNFAKALSKSCKKKMQVETCKCYGSKVIKRYNEVQVISIYEKMLESKDAQEMFFLSTSPELLSCMKSNNK